MTRILFHLLLGNNDPWVAGLKAADPSIDVRCYPDWGSPDDGPAYAYVWEPKPGLLAEYPNIKAIFSIGAGVDHLTRDPDLPDLPIIRMSDEGLKEAMAEYILMGTLMLHRRMPQVIEQQKQKVWERYITSPASEATVGILGFGELGKRAYDLLKPVGYKIRAWSRTPKQDQPGLTHFTGMEQLDDFLTGTDVVIGLLPQTDETIDLLNRDRLLKLNKGASVLNAGRGSLIVMDDLITLLKEGHLGGAMLDVFNTEPLPADHPAWTTERLIVTPHIAAITRPDSAGAYVIKMIQEMEAGGSASALLERDRGY